MSRQEMVEIAADEQAALLSVDGVHAHFVSRGLDNAVRTATALNGVSLKIHQGKVLGLVGETGAGKSLTAMTIMGLLRSPARVVAGCIHFHGKDLLQLSPQEMNRLRGNQIAMVVQNPRGSLDPLARIGDQLVRLHRAHRTADAGTARQRAIDALAAVGIPEPEARMRAWPHELSGGMAQRVLIAMALINEPDLLIADEPTTGLDVTVQAQILDLIREQVSSRHIGAVVITHDLGVVAHYCDDMAVMFAGSVVEQGPVKDVFARPAHPYTRSLLSATPERLNMALASTLGGTPPDLYNLPSGCTYRDRCLQAQAVCATAPPRTAVSARHVTWCHFAGEVVA